MASKTVNAGWVKTRVGDELGLNDADIAGIYGIEVKALDKHLSALANDAKATYERILSDVDSVRIGYRQIQVTDAQIQAIRNLLANYPFHPLVSVPTADGGVGWRLSGDDAQWVAFRAADLVNMDFNLGEVLRLRLNRVVIWPAEAEPAINKAFLDRVADVTFYLMELTDIV